MFEIRLQRHWNYIPKGPIDNKSALVQVMAWHRTGDKPLSEPIQTQFADAYMRHQGLIYFCLGFSTLGIHQPIYYYYKMIKWYIMNNY